MHGRKDGYFQLENLCYTLRMAIVRASEIGSYLYCRRAWRYRRDGVESQNKVELAAGTELHRQHGRKTLSALLLRTFGLILLLAAILLLVAFCTARFV
jgi:hypothetical protein